VCVCVCVCVCACACVYGGMILFLTHLAKCETDVVNLGAPHVSTTPSTWDYPHTIALGHVQKHFLKLFLQPARTGEIELQSASETNGFPTCVVTQ
jgi:hypothetical protein